MMVSRGDHGFLDFQLISGQSPKPSHQLAMWPLAWHETQELMHVRHTERQLKMVMESMLGPNI